MAKKRFTDIEIWDREWYMELKPVHKCLMKYIFDKCDASGCWKPNWKLASLHIGDTVEFKDLTYLPKDQYEVLSNGKIFIPDFINFQYGNLSKNSPAHKPIFLAIEKNNLFDRVFNRVSNTLQEKDIYKEKDKEEEKDKKGGPGENKKFNTMPTPEDVNSLPEQKVQSAIEQMKITQQTDIDKKQVIGMWEVFKTQKLTGNKFYENIEAVHDYFLNWIKKQNFSNGLNKTKGGPPSSGSRISGTSIIPADKKYSGRLD